MPWVENNARDLLVFRMQPAFYSSQDI